MRDCREDRLMLLVNGRLSGLALWQTHRHLKHCPQCQQTLAQLTALERTLRDLTTEVPDDGLISRVQAITPLQKSKPTRLGLGAWLPAPALGMVLGLLITVWLAALPQPRIVQLRVAFKTLPGVTAQTVIDVAEDLKPTNEARIAGWGSQDHTKGGWYVDLQVRALEPEDTLNLWSERLVTSPQLKQSKTYAWIQTGTKQLSVEASPAMSIPIGGAVGLILGALISLMIWLARTVRGPLLIPLVTTFIGLVIGAALLWSTLRTQRSMAVIRLTSPYQSSPYLSYEQIPLLVEVLKPEAPRGVRIYRQRQNFRANPSTGAYGEQLTEQLIVEGGEPTLHSTLLKQWLSKLTEQPLIAKAGWKLVVLSEYKKRDVSRLYPKAIGQYLLSGLLGGLAVGALLLFLIWLGRLLPGDMTGCILIGLFLGVALATVPTILKPKQYRAVGYVSFAKTGSMLTPQAQMALLYGGTPGNGSYPPKDFQAMSPSIETRPGVAHYGLSTTSTDPKRAKRYVTSWANQITISRINKLLGCEMGRSQTFVEPVTHTVTLLALAFWGGVVGLVVGLFMGLMRRR